MYQTADELYDQAIARYPSIEKLVQFEEVAGAEYCCTGYVVACDVEFLGCISYKWE